MRLALKMAIIVAGKTQRQVAAETRLLSENRLSEIVCGWVDPNENERAALARVLHREAAALFGDSRSDVTTTADLSQAGPSFLRSDPDPVSVRRLCRGGACRRDREIVDRGIVAATELEAAT